MPRRCRYDAIFSYDIRSISEVHGRKTEETRFVSMSSERSVNLGGNTNSVSRPPRSCASRLPRIVTSAPSLVAITEVYPIRDATEVAKLSGFDFECRSRPAFGAAARDV